jgi:glycerol-3-phosphate dehydrogenase subunit B
MGAIRPTCLAPKSMLAGDLSKRDPMLIVGFSNYFDFYPGYIVENLNSQGYFAQELLLDLPFLKKYRFINAMTLAKLFEEEEFRTEIAQAISPYLGNADRLGFPAVLGLNHPDIVTNDLENKLGIPVFEIAGLPPSIPGIRLYNLLLRAYKNGGGKVGDGMNVKSADCHDAFVSTIWSQASGRMKSHSADTYVLATGGFLGGGIQSGPDLIPEEMIFHLPLDKIQNNSWMFNTDYLDQPGHPHFMTGVSIE